MDDDKGWSKIRAFKSESAIHSNLAEHQLGEENSDETDQLIIPGLTTDQTLPFDLTLFFYSV